MRKENQSAATNEGIRARGLRRRKYHTQFFMANPVSESQPGKWKMENGLQL